MHWAWEKGETSFHSCSGRCIEPMEAPATPNLPPPLNAPPPHLPLSHSLCSPLPFSGPPSLPPALSSSPCCTPPSQPPPTFNTATSPFSQCALRCQRRLGFEGGKEKQHSQLTNEIKQLIPMQNRELTKQICFCAFVLTHQNLADLLPHFSHLFFTRLFKLFIVLQTQFCFPYSHILFSLSFSKPLCR